MALDTKARAMATRPAGKGKEAASAVAAPPPAPAPAAAQANLKRSLLWRMALAGLMILALLGALALFDYANAPDDELATRPQFPEPVPVRKPVLPVTVVDAPADPPADAPADAPAEAATDAAAATPLPTPSPTETVPAAAAVRRKATPGKEDPRSEPPPRPEFAAQPALPPPAGRPNAPAAAAAASQSVGGSALAVPPLTSGYVFPSGMFADLRRAEEWQAMLAEEGIPSTIEARLQIGPFKSRADAEAARRKLNKLGLETLKGVHKVGKP